MITFYVISQHDYEEPKTHSFRSIPEICRWCKHLHIGPNMLTLMGNNTYYINLKKEKRYEH